MLEEIRTITRRRDSYGYRQVRARVNRFFKRTYNEKRDRRVMRKHGHPIPPKVRRRTGRAHTGRIATEQSNVRWCSDALEIACWNQHRRPYRWRKVPDVLPAPPLGGHGSVLIPRAA